MWVDRGRLCQLLTLATVDYNHHSMSSNYGVVAVVSGPGVADGVSSIPCYMYVNDEDNNYRPHMLLLSSPFPLISIYTCTLAKW